MPKESKTKSKRGHAEEVDEDMTDFQKEKTKKEEKALKDERKKAKYEAKCKELALKREREMIGGSHSKKPKKVKKSSGKSKKDTSASKESKSHHDREDDEKAGQGNAKKRSKSGDEDGTKKKIKASIKEEDLSWDQMNTGEEATTCKEEENVYEVAATESIPALERTYSSHPCEFFLKAMSQLQRAMDGEAVDVDDLHQELLIRDKNYLKRLNVSGIAEFILRMQEYLDLKISPTHRIDGDFSVRLQDIDLPWLRSHRSTVPSFKEQVAEFVQLH